MAKHRPDEVCDCINPETGRKHHELPGDPPYHCAAAEAYPKAFDLTTNPTIDERRRLAREQPVVAAEVNPEGGFNGVFIPKQEVKDDQRQLIAIVCNHGHLTVSLALLCANINGQDMIERGFGEVLPTSGS